MLCLYPKKYFCFQLVSYQYILRENLQLAPDAVPVDKQYLLNLVLVEPWGASFTCGSEAGKSGCSLSQDGDHQQLSTYFSMKKAVCTCCLKAVQSLREAAVLVPGELESWPGSCLQTPANSLLHPSPSYGTALASPLAPFICFNHLMSLKSLQRSPVKNSYPVDEASCCFRQENCLK